MKNISIKKDKEYITLGQLLKIEGYVSTGGEAKIFLAEKTIYVDSNLENRRGRKLYRGMKVIIENNEYELS